METDTESLVLPALQRCSEELSAAGELCPAEDRAVLLSRLADHLRPTLALPAEPDANRLAQQLVCRLWNLPLQAPLGQLTAQLSRRLAADVLLLLAAEPAARRPLPLEGATQVLLTAARQSVDAGQLEHALALAELAQRDLLLRRIGAESQLATFSRRAAALRQLADLERARLACLLLRAEALHLVGNWTDADEAVREASGAFDAGPEQLQHLQRLLFNFGLREYRDRGWARAVHWLSRSLETGQALARAQCPAGLRGRTLELLARAHMMRCEDGDLDRATQLLQLAFSEDASLTLRLLILVCELRRGAGRDDPAGALQHCVEDAADWCREPADFVQLSDLLEQHERLPEALTVLRRAAERGCSGAVCRRSVRLLLALDRPDEALRTLAAYCSRPAADRDGVPVTGMVVALEDRAGALLAAGELEPAAQLLQQLANLTDLEPETTARLLRNVARCRRRQGQLAAAEPALRRALQLWPGHPGALYMLLQQYIAASATEDALQLVSCIAPADGASDKAALARLWRSLCGFALSRQMSGLYERLLEAVLCHLDDSTEGVHLAQCLVRSRIEILECDQEGAMPSPGPLIAALEKALIVVRRWQADHPAAGSGLTGWFSDVAWNVAVHGELEPADRCRLFTLSRLFMTSSQDLSDLSLGRMASLMAAAAALEAARQPGLLPQEKQTHLREAVSCVDECRRLTAQLGGAATGWAHHSALLLYEFEAKAGLDAPELAALLEATLSRPDVASDTLEAVAALLGRPALAARALQAAADRLLRPLPPADCDWDRLAAQQSRYIGLMLDNMDSPGLPADEVLRAVLSVRDVIREAGGRYPNMTTLYVMTRTWNQAVGLSMHGQMQRANRWAAAARGLAPLLAAQTEWYQHRMRLLPSAAGDLPPPASLAAQRPGPSGAASSTAAETAV